MLAQMHFIVISDYTAGSVREFFLQNKVLLDMYPLGDRSSLDLSASRSLSVELHRLLVYRDGHRVLVSMMGSVLAPLFIMFFLLVQCIRHRYSPCYFGMQLLTCNS